MEDTITGTDELAVAAVPVLAPPFVRKCEGGGVYLILSLGAHHCVFSVDTDFAAKKKARQRIHQVALFQSCTFLNSSNSRKYVMSIESAIVHVYNF